VVSQSLMSAGREFQTEGAATEKARPAMSVRVREMTSSGAAADRRCLAGAAVCITPDTVLQAIHPSRLTWYPLQM